MRFCHKSFLQRCLLRRMTRFFYFVLTPGFREIDFWRRCPSKTTHFLARAAVRPPDQDGAFLTPKIIRINFSHNRRVQRCLLRRITRIFYFVLTPGLREIAFWRRCPSKTTHFLARAAVRPPDQDGGF